MNKKLFLSLFFVITGLISAQEWELDTLFSHSNFEYGDLFPYPTQDIIHISNLLSIKNSSRVGFKLGPSFSDNYYFLIKEKESGFSWYTGMDWINTPGSDLAWTNNTLSGENRDFLGYFTEFELDQVVLGDRYHENSYLSVNFKHRSGYHQSSDDSLNESFFLHTPRLSLNYISAEDPFWSLLSFKSSLEIPLEMGHNSNNFWAFLALKGNINARVPILSKYLYAEFDLNGNSVISNFTPDSRVESYAYEEYDSRYNIDSQINLKSQFLEMDFIYPMSLAAGAFASLDYSNNNFSFVDLFDNPRVGAYLEYKMSIPYLVSFGVQAGVIYEISSSETGFYLRVF